jgi:hypothetical protein
MIPRPVRRGLRLALGFLVGAVLAARPAVACAPMPAATPQAGVAGGVARYEFRDAAMLPFLALWHAHRPAPLPAAADRVTVFAARDGRPLLLAYQSRGCLVGLLPVARAEVWAALLRLVGPVA